MTVIEIVNAVNRAGDNYDELVTSLLQAKKDWDIYARLGRLMSQPELPEELVLTDENFEERIKAFEKTAVLFYLSCM